MSWFSEFVETFKPANEDDATARLFLAPDPVAGNFLIGGGDPEEGTPPPPGKSDAGTLLSMPSLTDSDRRTAKRKAQADLQRRGGRNSTILTGDPLGGGF